MNQFIRLRSITLVIICLYFSIHLSAQQKHKTPDFIEKVNQFQELIKADEDEFISFVSEWESETTESGDSMAMAHVWMEFGEAFRRRRNFPKAKMYMLKAMDFIERNQLSGEFVINRQQYSILLVQEGSYTAAIEQALISIDEMESYNPYLNWINYHSLAETYHEMNNFPMMDHYLKKWYNLVNENKSRKDYGYSLYVIYSHYFNSGMLEEATLFQERYYQFKAKRGENLEDKPGHVFMLIEGETPEEQIINLNKFLPYHVDNGRMHLVSKSYRALGRLYLEINDPWRAVESFNKSKASFETEELPNQLGTLEGLSKAYEMTGRYELALNINRDYIEKLNQFKNVEVLAQANEIEAKYENHKKEQELSLKESQIKMKNKWLILIAGAGSIVLGLALFIFILYRKLRINNMTLSKANAEKSTLLNEIHHRVKNNLQVISSLLSLQSQYVKDETAISALKEGQSRVDSMALIHQNLYREDSITGINMKNYIPLLANNIFNSYNTRGEEIKIESEIEDIILDVSTVIPIGLVLNELITNSLKHAFKNIEKGIIRIYLKEDKGTLLINVKDNGQGFRLGNEGFGMKLIKSFTRKLEGEIFIESENGTNVVLIVKNYQNGL